MRKRTGSDQIIDSKTKTQIASLGVGNVENIGGDKYIIYTKNKFESGLDVHLTQSFKNKKIPHAFLLVGDNSYEAAHFIAKSILSFFTFFQS